MGDLTSLCASGWSGYIADAIVAVFLIITTLVCGKRGFFSCILKIVSTFVAFLLAVVLANVVLEATGGLFGLLGWFESTFTEAFSKVESFQIDVSQSGVDAALKDQNVTAILAQLVLKMADKKETIEAGTTLAQLLGEATASLAGTLSSGLILFIAIKLVVLLLKKILNRIAKKVSPVGKLNTILGAAFGVVYSLTIVSILLAILAVIPSTAISEYFASTLFVGALFEHNPLVYVLSWFI